MPRGSHELNLIVHAWLQQLALNRIQLYIYYVQCYTNMHCFSSYQNRLQSVMMSFSADQRLPPTIS